MKIKQVVACREEDAGAGALHQPLVTGNIYYNSHSSDKTLITKKELALYVHN